MSRSHTVPEEVLAVIAEHVDSKGDQETIRALRLTSRAWNRVATPLLRRRVNLASPYVRYKDIRGAYTTRVFVYDVIQHPERAESIKEIIVGKRWDLFDESVDDYSSSSESGDTMSPEYLDVVDTAPPQIQGVSQQDARKLMENGLQELDLACVTHLITLSKAVEKIELHEDCLKLRKLIFDWADQYRLPIESSFSTLPRTGGQFDQLREVEIGLTTGTVHLDDVLKLLKLPRLHVLKAHELEDELNFLFSRRLPVEDTDDMIGDDEFDIQEHVIRTNNPMTFVLEGCRLTARGLRQLLTACSQPYSLTARWRRGGWQDWSDARHIAQAVWTCGRELKCVILDVSEAYNDFAPQQRRFINFGDCNAEVLGLPVLTLQLGQSEDARGRVSHLAEELPVTLKKLYVLGTTSENEADYDELLNFERLCNLQEVVTVSWQPASKKDFWGGTVRGFKLDYQFIDGIDLASLME
jgi:hypothetical protein